MNQKEMCALAVDTVIGFCEENGVKLRRLDFDLDNINNQHTVWDVLKQKIIYKNSIEVLTINGNVSSVMVKIAYTGRWEKQLKEAKDLFLNYYNARLEENFLSFSFTAKELELLSMKRSGENPDADEEKLEKIIAKINKALALADRSQNSSEHEAISASLFVQKLLAKYNLTMADVTGEQKEEDVEQTVADVGKGKKWKYGLADVIANNFACKCFSVGTEQVVFYGYKANIISARRVYVYLLKVGDRLAKSYAKKYREDNGGADGIYNSFCLGFVGGIRKELEKQCTALSIVVQPKVEEEWKKFSESFGVRNSTIKLNDREAYEEGFVEGKRALNATYLE